MVGGLVIESVAMNKSLHGKLKFAKQASYCDGHLAWKAARTPERSPSPVWRLLLHFGTSHVGAALVHVKRARTTHAAKDILLLPCLAGEEGLRAYVFEGGALGLRVGGWPPFRLCLGYLFVNLSLPTFLCVFRTAGERTGTGGGTDIDRREKLLYF